MMNIMATTSQLTSCTRTFHHVHALARTPLLLTPPRFLGGPLTQASAPSCHHLRQRRRQAVSCASSSGQEASTEREPLVGPQSGNGAVSRAAPGGAAAQHASASGANEELPSGELVYVAPSGLQRALTSFRLMFALPWRRFKKGSILVLKLDGNISEQKQGRFGDAMSLPQICESLEKAAYDPRINGVYIKVGPLAAGWAKLIELRRYLALFRQSGKPAVAYMTSGGEKEYFLATAASELYIPPSASLSLRGLAVSGSFLRGVLDKVGVEPELRRIGQYKSAGDQLLRRDMSAPQREQLTALLDDIFSEFVGAVAEARGKTAAEVEALLDEGVYDMERLAAGGWVTSLLYEDQVRDKLREVSGGKPDELRGVDLKRYASVSPGAFGLHGGKVIAIIRTAGNIVGGSGGVGGSGSVITAEDVIRQLRSVAKNKAVKAVVLRIDSGGGDALASDLMWREIQKLAEKKPVVASMSDVAASGGYYMAMGARTIVAEPLTITGSIGVVTGKFNLAEVYRRTGFAKEVISRGRFAELLAENRAFSPEEAELFDKAAMFAYESFRNKAAESRGLSVEAMQEVAQGRVWSGKRALERGLVDALGGVSRAVAIAKQAMGAAPGERVRVLELSRQKMSPLALLSGGASARATAAALPLLLRALGGGSSSAGLGNSMGSLVLLSALQEVALQNGIALDGSPQASAPPVQVDAVGSTASHAALQPQAVMPPLAVHGSSNGGQSSATGTVDDVHLAELLQQLL